MSNIIVANLIPHLPKDTAWDLAKSSKNFHKIVMGSDAFWLTLINSIPDVDFPTKKEVVRCFKIINDVTARKLFVNIRVMICTKKTTECPAMPLSLRIGLINNSEKLSQANQNTFWASLSPLEQITAFPAHMDRILLEMDKKPSILFALPDPLQDQLLSNSDCIGKLNNVELATLALRYIKSEDELGYNRVMWALAAKTGASDEQEFCESLLIKTLATDQVTIEFLTHIFSLISRKDYSLKKVAIIHHALKHKNAIELIELLVAKGAKAIGNQNNRSPIEYYLYHVADEERINVEILNYLQKLGDNFFEQFPLYKVMAEVEAGNFKGHQVDYFRSYTEENIGEKLLKHDPKNSISNPSITQLVKTLLKAGFKANHFIPLIEKILTDQKNEKNSDENLIEILENLKAYGINLAAWEMDGENLLHMLFKGNYWASFDVAHFMIENNIDLLKQNREGKLPLNLLLVRIFNQSELELKIHYLKLYLPVIQDMIEHGVCIFDEKAPFTQFSEGETLWLACLLGYKDLIYQRFAPKHIRDISALALTDDIEVVKHLLESIEFNSFMSPWIQFLKLYAFHDVLNVEVLDLVLKKFNINDKSRRLDTAYVNTLDPLLLLHDHRRIPTEILIQFLMSIPTIYNPKCKCEELVWCISPIAKNTSVSSFYRNEVIVSFDQFKDRMDPESMQSDSVAIWTKNPLKEISQSVLGFRLLLPLYEIYPDWFKEGDFLDVLYRTLLDIRDPIIQNEGIEVCNDLLRKIKLADWRRKIIYDHLFTGLQFSKILEGTQSLQQHIVDQFLTPQLLEDKELSFHLYGGDITNFENLINLLRAKTPTQEFWNRIKNALERCSIDYTCPLLIDRFIERNDIIYEKDIEIFKQILEFLWGKTRRIPINSLHILIGQGSTTLPVMEHLIWKKHPIDHQNASNNTPLHVACTMKNRLDIVKFLLDKGANPSLQNDDKETPWDIAKRKEDYELGILLQKDRLK